MLSESKAESRSKDLDLYPEKPKTESGFKKAVAWFGGRELIASLKDMLMYGIFGENLDPRSWMNPNIYPNLVKKIINQKEIDVQINKEKTENPENPNFDTLYTSISAEASKLVKDDPKFRQDLYLKIEQEWAKRLYDQWEWKRTNYDIWENFSTDSEFWNKLQPQKILEKRKPVAPGATEAAPDEKYLDEFWFDYISDSGDGQMGVYNVACMCLSDLWLDVDKDNKNNPEKEVRFTPPDKTGLNDKIFLPRGSFLFVGGDTAYHSANYATLVDRFQIPFHWAFTSVRKFAAENYELKPEKKAEAEQAAKKQFEKSEDDKTNLLETLKGSLPGLVKELEYSDTEPTRPILGIPANHDYYDGIDGFNRQFRRPPFENTEENQISDGNRGKFLLQIPTFSRKQEASYIAICLPFEWWMFGVDSENEKLDFRQELYFTDIVERYKPKKLIVATPEPTTVFGKKSDPEDKTATYLKAITKGLGLSQPFLTNGKIKKNEDDTTGEIKTTEPDLSGNFCRLDLSGDVHHYARYWGEDSRKLKDLEEKGEDYQSENYASVVAGGGGAFFDVTKTLIGEPLNRRKNPIFNGKNSKDKKGKEIKGEIPPQEVFPSEEDSISKTADKLFDVWNLRNGGYVQYAGFAIAMILFYFLTNFSNFSFVIQSYRNASFKELLSILCNHLSISIGLLAVTAIFIYITANRVHKLIEDLKLRSFKNKLRKNYDARMKQLAWKYIWFLPAIFFFGVALYNIFYNRNLEGQNEHLNNFLISCNLIVIFIIFFLLIKLSSEHTNWLAVRFKIVRKTKRKTITQRYEDPNEQTKSWIKKILGFLSRFYSYEYFLSNALIIAAFALLVTGINIFGAVSISRTLADVLLVSIIAGFLILIIFVFARNTGANYHKSFKYKSLFTIFGIWHYILQLGTPLVLFFFGSWNFLFLNFLIVGLLNGSGFISFLIRHFLTKGDRESKWEAVANFRIAAVMTKYLNRYVLFSVWVLYGAAILLYPLLSKNYITVDNGTQMRDSVFNSIFLFFTDNSKNLWFYEFFQKYLSYYFNVEHNIFDRQFAAYLTIWVSILVIGYIGYLMSRVWLGWYLAISMHFDGHNNEAGGAARIEGFKHILRIKVTRENITVYVIGFDEAQAEMSKMEMKLVDKFTLTPKPVS